MFKLEKTYGSDLSSRSWQVIKNIILVKRKIKWDLLEIINTIFDPLKTAVSNVTFREGSRPGKSFTGITEMVKDGTWDNITRLLIASSRMMQDEKWQPEDSQH